MVTAKIIKYDPDERLPTKAGYRFFEDKEYDVIKMLVDTDDEFNLVIQDRENNETLWVVSTDFQFFG